MIGESRIMGGDSFEFYKESKDITENHNVNGKSFREIHPEEGISVKEATEFWNKEFSPESEKVYLDDNGEIYRVGDILEPNKSFEVNGYKFETDDEGRKISAEGKLRIRDPEFKRNMDDMAAVGKGDQKEGDHRGHIIGHQFGGSGGIENLVPMRGELNQGDYLKLENMLADAVKDGTDVRLKVELSYEGDSNRPSEFRVTYSIDGEKDIVVFRNNS